MPNIVLRVFVCWFIFMLIVSLCIIEPRAILVILGLMVVIVLTAIFALACSPTPDDPY